MVGRNQGCAPSSPDIIPSAGRFPGGVHLVVPEPDSTHHPPPPKTCIRAADFHNEIYGFNEVLGGWWVVGRIRWGECT